MSIEAKRFCDECGAANRSTSKFCVACGKPLSIYVGKTRSAVTGLLTDTTILKQRYRIVRKIGQGGFSKVYFAEDMAFNAAPRVVKEMSIQLASSQPLDPQELQQSIEAFKQEALLLASLTHPNLPRIYDHFEEQSRWYIVMDYIEGQTLETMLEAAPGGKLELAPVLRIANQLCTVLHYLHTRQPPIIFRDLKPANIMITEDEHIYLIDFGIARLFKPGQDKDTIAFGSPGYAAPEQYGSAQSTAQADIYSLGATLHRLLSGHNRRDDPFHFPPLALDQYAEGPGLEALIQRMISLQKDQRPASIQEIKQTLRKLSSMSESGNTSTFQSSQPQAPSPNTVKREIKQTLRKLSSKPGNTFTFQSSQPQAPSPNTVKDVIVASSGGQYSNISDAIKDVPEGTRILVRPGTYTESIVLDKNVEIIGDGPCEQIVLIGNDTSCIRIATDSAVVRGITIRGLAENHYAIDIPRGRFHLSGCIVTSETHACIGIHNSTAQPLIHHCIIRDGNQGGILIYDQGAGVIEDCEIAAHKFAGVEVREGGNPLLRRCKMYNGRNNGIRVHNQGGGTFEDCEIFANELAGVGVKTGGNPLLRRCKMYDGQEGGILVWEQGEGTFEDCEVFANELAGVEVKTGGKPLLRRCKIHDGQETGILVWEQGEGTFEDCEIFANKLAGVEVREEGKPLLYRCKIHDGQTNGIRVYEQGGGTFEDCEVFANELAGVGVKTGGNPLLRRCKMRDGQEGGVMVWEQGEGTFEDCEIFANELAGVEVRDGGKPLLRQCKIYGGKASGIYVHRQGEGTFENCETFTNKTYGLYIGKGGYPVLRRCEFRDREKHES